MGAIFHSYGILLVPGVRGHWVMWWSCLSWVPFIGKGRAGGASFISCLPGGDFGSSSAMPVPTVPGISIEVFTAFKREGTKEINPE